MRRRWQWSESRRAYESARPYQRSTRRARKVFHRLGGPPRESVTEESRQGLRTKVDPLMHRDVAERTEGVLRMLAPAEEKVIRMRFGIGYEREHTLEEIAGEFGLTRERIRQIEVQTLRKLRSFESPNHLQPLISIQLAEGARGHPPPWDNAEPLTSAPKP